jgi:hypothetical protein
VLEPHRSEHRRRSAARSAHCDASAPRDGRAASTSGGR